MNRKVQVRFLGDKGGVTRLRYPTLFMRDNDYEHHDSLINTNPYHYIAEITNINELVSNPKIKEIEGKAQKYLHWKRTYDSIGNMLTELSYKENGDTSGYQRYEYDENNNNIYFYNEWSKENHWEYYYEYEKENALFEEEKETEAKPTNLLQSVRVDFDWRENRNRISDITFFKYDKNDRLIEKTKFNKGEFQDKYVYEYNAAGQVIKRTSYVYNPSKIASVETYSYNKEGNIIKETDEDFRSGEKTENEYRYEYEYYR
jgi:quinol monooxygenase YgiN